MTAEVTDVFLEASMIGFYRLLKVLMTTGLMAFLASVIMLSSFPEAGWAIPLSTSSLNQPHALVAIFNQAKATAQKIEGRVQEGVGNMTGDLNTQAEGKAKQFDANTQEAILESMDNPSYQPDRQGLSKRDREAVKDLGQDVRDEFNQTQGPD